MMLVGLTGGIASGKSFVADCFADLGVPVLDADQLARDAVIPGSQGLNAIQAAFGPGILTSSGELDRNALRAIIFKDDKQRETLNDILHPRIRELSELRIQALAEEQHAYCIYAVPLLVETGQVQRFDQIIVVDVPVSVQRSRLMARDRNSEKQAQAMIDAQASRGARLAVADEVIDNSSSKEHTRTLVEAVHKRLLDHSDRSTSH